MRITLLKRTALLGAIMAVTGGLATAQIEFCEAFGPGPGDIPDNDPLGIVLTLPATGSEAITDVDVGLDITHTWQGDLIIELTDPSGAVTVPLLWRAGDSNGTGFGFAADHLGVPGGDFFVLDDEAAEPYDSDTGWGLVPDPGIESVVGPWIPYGQFSIDPPGGLIAFDGLTPEGVWTIFVSDNAGGDTGTVNVVCLFFELDLPVEMTSFTAQVDGREVALNWETASETNNAGFEVQLREGEEWKALGFVDGRGTTTEAQTYSYTASDLGVGTHAFRLKQIDFDGAFEYSDEVEATVETPGTHVLSSAYPNPFNPRSQFTLAVAADQNVTVELFNTLGQRVATLFNGTVAANESEIVTISGAGLLSGTYVVRVNAEFFSDALSVTLLK